MLAVDFVQNLENRMRFVQVRHYASLLQNQWWQQVASVQNISTGEEIIAWLLETARIKRLNKEGGNTKYSAMVTAKLALSSEFAGDSIEVPHAELNDRDANGVGELVGWSQQVTTYAAYWPQAEVSRALITGHNDTDFICFDGEQLFATAHPLNYRQPNLGTYATLFTGAASGRYPGACPIHGAEVAAAGAVTAEVALVNLSRVVGYIRSIRSANGVSPARLRPKAILCSPRLHPRAVQLTNAKLLVQGGGTGAVYGGAADVEAVISSLGLGQPIACEELAGVDDDTTFYIVCENDAMPEVSGLVYANRESFYTNFYTGRGAQDGYLEAMLNRTDMVEYHMKGRNGVFAGMPGLIFKVMAS